VIYDLVDGKRVFEDEFLVSIHVDFENSFGGWLSKGYYEYSLPPGPAPRSTDLLQIANDVVSVDAGVDDVVSVDAGAVAIWGYGNGNVDIGTFKKAIYYPVCFSFHNH
jgi:hypothetical protein